MARLLRIEFEDAIYHLTARGNERQAIFRSERDRRRFLEFLERACDRLEVRLVAFVLMGNHFHLVAQTPRGNLSRWMHWLLVSYTSWFNWRYQRSGHLFQGRYKSLVVEEGEYLLAVGRYVHLNPVRGVSLGEGTPVERRERLRGYEWSSYAGTAGLREGFRFVQPELLLEEMGGGRSAKDRQLSYRRFVEEGLTREIENPLVAAQWQAALGSESFVQQLKDRWAGRKGRDEAEAKQIRRERARMAPKEALAAVAARYGIGLEQLCGTDRLAKEARQVAMWLIWERCGVSQREIGEIFGGVREAAVAQRLRRVPEEARRDADKLQEEMSSV